MVEMRLKQGKHYFLVDEVSICGRGSFLLNLKKIVQLEH